MSQPSSPGKSSVEALDRPLPAVSSLQVCMTAVLAQESKKNGGCSANVGNRAETLAQG